MERSDGSDGNGFVRYFDVPRHVYVHVPFCARRCSYCDFSIAVRRTVPVDEYCAALESELTIRSPHRGQSRGAHLTAADRVATDVDTIYLGGGTPSRLGGAGVARALAAVREHFPLAPGAEVTTEANPESVDATRLRRLREAVKFLITIIPKNSSHLLRVVDLGPSRREGKPVAVISGRQPYASMECVNIVQSPVVIRFVQHPGV